MGKTIIKYAFIAVFLLLLLAIVSCSSDYRCRKKALETLLPETQRIYQVSEKKATEVIENQLMIKNYLIFKAIYIRGFENNYRVGTGIFRRVFYE